MSKVRRLYHQKYREEWERCPSFEDWLSRGEDGLSAHCKICNANVLARLASIKQHHCTAKHQKALQLHQIEDMGIPVMLKQEATQKYIISCKSKSKSKRLKTIKIESVESLDPNTNSNDSILEDLLGSDDMEQEYMQVSETEMDTETKPDTFQEDRYDEMQDDNITDENIISEFDLFGKSVSLQLNNMELEDALLCQERLQVVLTEFRLKILKRKAKRQF
ncbi:uncharacterized protein LOC6562761 [Drosophila grimshawi]|uniref:GH10242 n=1 Tax=Drosophila grimshawi TaxID=7222 RepID=B4JB46_DROGR|nr:uncharacterized protein LOC6562761 [Drosophila grimshawi]EDW03938.1 GH10242 [Drosophila grimshawi]